MAAGPEPPEGMVLVPAGEFLMGSDEGGADEAPAHRVQVSAFYVDQYEVTNAQFAVFARDSGHAGTIEGPWFRYSAEGCLVLINHYEKRHGVGLNEFTTEAVLFTLEDVARWRSADAALKSMLSSDLSAQELIEEQARLPVRGVAWRDAAAYAKWAGKRLLTEAEWEKAARGADGRAYPWGTEWDPQRCRAAQDAKVGPASVGTFPTGVSPYGCHDMAGNVWEWVADWYGETAYGSADRASDPKGPEGLPEGQLPGPSPDVDLLRTPLQGRESDTRKVIRGGGWSGPEAQARFNLRCTRRLWSNPSYGHPDVGFRCGRDVEASQ